LSSSDRNLVRGKGDGFIFRRGQGPGLEMSKVAAPKAKPARRVRGKGARIKLSARRRSKAEDRLDGAAATKALRESADRIPYEKARRDLDL
jgi:hypothetical protein